MVLPLSENQFPMAGRESSDELKRPQSVPFPALASPAFSAASVDSERIPMPKWAKDAAISIHSRTSRASSIVSTKTRISINTLQEDARSARSVDLMLGGRSFHINRDGSKVTSFDDDLPPYSAPISEVTTPHEYPVGSEPSSPTTPTGQPSDPLDFHPRDEPCGYPMSRLTSALSSRAQVDPYSRLPTRETQPTSGNILNFSSLDTKNPKGARSQDHGKSDEGSGVRRGTSFNPGYEVFPAFPKRRTVSHSDIPDILCKDNNQPTLTSPLRRRNAVRLPRILTALSGGRFGTNSASLAEHGEEDPISPEIRITRSAGPSLGGINISNDSPPSPTFIGRDATAKFPSLAPAWAQGPSALTVGSGQPQQTRTIDNSNDKFLVVLESPAQVEEGHADTEPPPPMDTENDISIHYTRLIRSIDRDHRRVLHERDKGLAAMRERLNEVDQVYRQELRARDFTIEDLRRRLTALEESVQAQTERARNEVEDLWEARWKDRDRHLVERMRRIELDSQRNIERAIAERDEEWAATWAKKNEQLLKQLQVAQEAANQGPILS